MDESFESTRLSGLSCKHPPDLQVGLSEQTAEFSCVLRAALRGSDVHQQLQTQTKCFHP